MLTEYRAIQKQTLLNSNCFALDAGVQVGFSGKGSRSLLPKETQYAKQVHGTKVVCVDDSDFTKTQEADGVYTLRPSTVVGVQTADCLPILVYVPEVPVVMALHAGWRGLAAGVLSEGLQTLLRTGASLSTCKMVLGPHISVANFEVGPEVIEAFKKSAIELGIDPNLFSACVVSSAKAGKFHFDLSLFAILNAVKKGVQMEHMVFVDQCTVRDHDLWHSYRREGQGAGRNWSFIHFT